jgi:hypothetical protein
MATIDFPNGDAWVAGGVAFRAVIQAARDVRPLSTDEAERLDRYEALKAVPLRRLPRDERERLSRRLLAATRRLHDAPPPPDQSESWVSGGYQLLRELEAGLEASLTDSGGGVG